MLPYHGDPDFQRKVSGLQEYQFFGVPEIPFVATEQEYEAKVQASCAGFEKAIYQHLMQHHLSWRSPLRGLLLYHGLGVGKTCSSITIAEALLTDHNAREEPKVWVVLPHALQKSFEESLFNVARIMDTRFVTEQCMSDKYRHMVHGLGGDTEAIRKKILAIIKSRYAMFTYDGFASEVQRRNMVVRDKVIIVDEAHNLRIQETDKKAAQALMDVAREGVNNKIVLLSATPMYNEPDEVFWLLSVLCANDKRQDVLRRLPTLYNTSGARNEGTAGLLRQLASEYVSYIKGRNPFTFAARLSPRDSGIPIYESADKWEAPIRDGLVPTPCSTFQQQAIAAMKKGDTVHHQALNICYPSANGTARVGESGFFSVFQRDVETDPVYVSYIQPDAKPLFPVPDKLGVVAPKIQRICDMVRSSEGVVVIYSQFIWSGVFPVAVALEHMGFRRHGGNLRNILKNPEIMDPPVRYPGIPFPSYCILSGESAVMGNAKIEDMLRQINSPKNRHGEVVKVVIMSPVAGEGLSLRNVREVHVLDPWYHLNRIEQVVGRAFRTCQHTALPLEERNVTVFLHAATNPDPNGPITTDIKSYKIAARKAQQTDETEALIRDAAIDCSLLKHVNYFPKERFGFDVLLRTSRGVTVPFHFGDDPKSAPQCADPTAEPDAASVRKDVYRELIPTGLLRLKKFIEKAGKTYFTFQELQDAIAMHPTITQSVLVAATNDKSMRLAVHRDRFVVRQPASTKRPVKIRLMSHVAAEEDAAPPAVSDDCDSDAVIANQPVDDRVVGRILIYKALNAKCWPIFAKRIITYGSDIPANIARHVRVLYEEGAFIGAQELSRHRNPSRRPYIGFVDIFDTNNDFNVVLYDHDRTMFREATDVEVAAIKKVRRQEQRPVQNDVLYAVMEPHKYKKKFDVPITNEIKVFTPSVAGNQKGIVCESLKKNDTIGYLNNLGVTSTEFGTQTKEQLCFTLALELIKQRKFYFAPSFKPT